MPVALTSHVSLPRTAKPSMPVQMDAALFHEHKKAKMEKANIISTMARHLLGQCFVCWARTGHYGITKDKKHTFFVNCNAEGKAKFVPNAMGWMALKRQLKFAKYQYCHWCGLPQEEYLPDSHPRFKTEEPIECPLEDIVAVLCWFVFTDPTTLAAAQKAFAGLHAGMTAEEFGQWIGIVQGPSCFYNGLELVIWLWTEKVNG
jgi:hypothetical protein